MCNPHRGQWRAVSSSFYNWTTCHHVHASSPSLLLLIFKKKDTFFKRGHHSHPHCAPDGQVCSPLTPRCPWGGRPSLFARLSPAGLASPQTAATRLRLVLFCFCSGFQRYSARPQGHGQPLSPSPSLPRTTSVSLCHSSRQERPQPGCDPSQSGLPHPWGLEICPREASG